MPRKSKSKDIESKSVVAWDWDGLTSNSHDESDINVLMLDCGDGCAAPYIY